MAKGLIQAAHWRLSTLIVSETAVIAAAISLTAYARLAPEHWIFTAADIVPKALLATCVCQLCLYYSDLYDDPRAGGDNSALLIRTLQALGMTLLVLALLYGMFPALTIGRGVIGPGVTFAAAALIAWRIAFGWLTRQVGPRERLLLVGTNPSALALARELRQREELGVEIVGYVDVESQASPSGLLPLLGTIEDVPPIVRARQVDRVVVSLADARGKLPMDKLLEMKLAGVRFDHFASVYEEHTGKIAVENLRPSWLIFSAGFAKSRVFTAVKRLMDVVLSGIGLIVAGPIILALAAAVRLTSPGAAFYSQRRVGRQGRVFEVHKLRSMCANAEKDTGPVWAGGASDMRVTKLGRIMRRTRLDELPQLWNIFIGEMSLVGPRPERPEFVQQLSKEIPFYGQRHIVKPGLTGWAQVRYTYGASLEDAMEKLQYDLFYIKHMSVKLDLFIIIETVKTVLLRRGV
jgi:sugar transferase (PEP-CTERM system associated)